MVLLCLFVYGNISPLDKLNAKIIYSLCDTVVNIGLLLGYFLAAIRYSMCLDAVKAEEEDLRDSPLNCLEA